MCASIIGLEGSVQDWFPDATAIKPTSMFVGRLFIAITL